MKMEKEQLKEHIDKFSEFSAELDHYLVTSEKGTNAHIRSTGKTRAYRIKSSFKEYVIKDPDLLDFITPQKQFIQITEPNWTDSYSKYLVTDIDYVVILMKAELKGL